MSDRKEVWSSGTPVLSSLPANGYQNNEVTTWLTSWVDQELSGVATKLQGLHNNLDPSTAPVEWLDYLGWLVGMSDRYWDTQWTPTVKRGMIANSYHFFNTSGSLQVIKDVLDVHSIPYDIWVDGSLRLPFKLSGVFGSPQLRYYVRVPLSVSRGGGQWREAERTIRNYSAAVVNGKVTYQGFKLGYSRLGDPLF